MTLGVRDLRDLALPTAWDANYIALHAMRDGTTYERVFNTLAGAIAAFNNSLDNHPWLPLLTFQTTDLTSEYREGGGEGWEEHAEYTTPEAMRASMGGHMLPIKSYDKGLGWTWDFFEEGRMSQVEADIDVLLETALDLIEIQTLTRLFKIEDVLVGNTGYSPGFCYGGVGSVAFTPPTHQGTSFASAHTHYLRYASSALAQAVAAMVNHLVEHGKTPPFEMWVSDADKTTWAAVSDDTEKVWFRQAQRSQVSYSGTTLAAPTVSDETYTGVIETPSGVVYVRPLKRVPTGYAATFKPAAANDRRNPIYWRYEEKYGPGIVPINLQKMGHAVNRVVGYSKFGFGVGPDRTAAVLLEVDDAGVYETPVIT